MIQQRRAQGKVLRVAARKYRDGELSEQAFRSIAANILGQKFSKIIDDFSASKPRKIVLHHPSKGRKYVSSPPKAGDREKWERLTKKQRALEINQRRLISQQRTLENQQKLLKRELIEAEILE